MAQIGTMDARADSCGRGSAPGPSSYFAGAAFGIFLLGGAGPLRIRKLRCVGSCKSTDKPCVLAARHPKGARLADELCGSDFGAAALDKDVEHMAIRITSAPQRVRLSDEGQDPCSALP